MANVRINTGRIAISETLANSVGVRTAIEVGPQAVVPVVVRGGKEIAAPSVNLRRVDELLTQFPPIGRVAIARVVSQSLPPGNRVPKGTPIDLVLMPSGQIPIHILDNVHRDVATKAIEDVYPTLTNPTVVDIVSKYQTAEQVSDADRSAFAAAVAPILAINEGAADASFGAAFQTMKQLQAFG